MVLLRAAGSPLRAGAVGHGRVNLARVVEANIRRRHYTGGLVLHSLLA